MFHEIRDANIEIHAHPLNRGVSITDIIDAMDCARLDVVALSALNKEVFPDIYEEVKENYEGCVADQAGIRLPSGKYLLNGREHETQEGFHVLTIGSALNGIEAGSEVKRVIEQGLEQEALVVIAHPFIAGKMVRNLGRPSPEQEHMLENLCREYAWQIGLEWNAYFIPWMQTAASKALELVFGQDIRFYDINKGAEKLSERLARQGYFVPVVAATDLHANSTELLSAMGTSRFITHVRGETASDIVASAKQNVFSGMYQNQKAYVSALHFVRAMCRPASLQRYLGECRERNKH